jgi:hypothetical protein
MFAAAPPSRRPSWYAATTVVPKAKLSGSTAVSCWLSRFAYGSTDSRRDTISQSAATLSPRSELTTSVPRPHATVSLPVKAVWRRSARAVPRIVAAAAVDARAESSSNGRRRRNRGPA